MDSQQTKSNQGVGEIVNRNLTALLARRRSKKSTAGFRTGSLTGSCLDLQISLLAEHEVTRLISLVRAIT